MTTMNNIIHKLSNTIHIKDIFSKEGSNEKSTLYLHYLLYLLLSYRTAG